MERRAQSVTFCARIVTPAKAGAQRLGLTTLGPGLRRGDEPGSTRITLYALPPAFARAALYAAVIALPNVVRAAPACAVERNTERAAPRRWAAPLDRTVSIEGTNVSLRDALDRLATAGKFRLSYAVELLPLDRRVCGTFDGIAAGDALVRLLDGTSLEPVVLGSDQVVLAPTHASRDDATRDSVAWIERPTHVTALDRVVVTENAASESTRGSAVAIDVVRGKQIAERGSTTLAGALDDAVPGVWMWTQSPSALLARWGSIRGASSFGVSAPKIYVDGVEVANPLLVTALAPETIDRVEVIRGPQGAALYGADAISGVINVVTRHDGVGADGARVEVRSDAGFSHSEFSPLGVFAQRHAITFRDGTATRSFGGGLSLGTLGNFVPGAASRELAAHGDFRLIGARSGLTLSARVLDKRAGAPTSPLLSATATTPIASGTSAAAGTMPGVGMGGATALAADTTAAQSMRQYTLGATATFGPGGRWTHQAVVGLDGYRLADPVTLSAALLSPSDSALRAARGGADRATLRASSVGRFGGDGRDVTVTLSADHSQLREETAASSSTLSLNDPNGSVMERAWRNSTGLVAQTDVALNDALYLSSGLRLERDAGYVAHSDVVALPTLGAAFVRQLGGAEVKLRAAYGKGVRPPHVATTSLASLASRTIVPADLEAETQSGVEAGVDVTLGRALGLHVTRFDQRASGLIQAVALATLNGGATTPAWLPRSRRSGYVLENVGQIANRGWELQSTMQTGRLALTGALSLVDSRVARTTAGYTGDLRTGDRMLEVPARTTSLSATWNAPRWSTTWSVARASDWVGYDRLGLTADLAAAGSSAALSGDRLRAYWRNYSGVTRVRASAARELPHGLSLIFTGDNLLNYQRGEPDDVTVVPGRTMTLGVRARM